MLAGNVLHGAPSSAMMRRAVVATAGFFDEALPAIEDHDYWLRVTRWFDVEHVDEPLIRYHDAQSQGRRSRVLRANLEFSGVDPSPVVVIPNGVPVDFWSASQPGVERRDPIVLSVGRLHPVKGHDVLLRAFARLRARVPKAQLVLAGGGGYRADLERLAHGLGLASAVTFAGQIDAGAVRDLMGGARVFVLPSRSEGLPLALLEAMAAGVPVVATRVGGVPDVATPDTAGLVPPEDPAALAAALEEVLMDSALAQQMSRNGRMRARLFSAGDIDALRTAAPEGGDVVGQAIWHARQRGARSGLSPSTHKYDDVLFAQDSVLSERDGDRYVAVRANRRTEAKLLCCRIQESV
jgi:glycosyltransferase involved in cell wall biosynthesis